MPVPAVMAVASKAVQAIGSYGTEKKRPCGGNRRAFGETPVFQSASTTRIILRHF